MSSSLKVSLLFHVFFLFLVVGLTLINSRPKDLLSTIKFEVKEIEKIIESPTVIKKASISNLKTANTLKPVREVFGTNKNALTNENDKGPEVKIGNTLNKAEDDKILNSDDAEKIEGMPVLAEEYLISEMPKVLTEYKAPYPKTAKEKNIEGDVILDIIIDSNGVVKKAILISGPGHGLNEVAMTSIYKFKFKPARIDNQTVAVKIRYAIHFVLEK